MGFYQRYIFRVLCRKCGRSLDKLNCREKMVFHFLLFCKKAIINGTYFKTLMT